MDVGALRHKTGRIKAIIGRLSVFILGGEVMRTFSRQAAREENFDNLQRRQEAEKQFS
jgi:hypothetical protein